MIHKSPTIRGSFYWRSQITAMAGFTATLQFHRCVRIAAEISAAPAFSLLCDASLEHVPKLFLSHDQIPRVSKKNLGAGDNRDNVRARSRKHWTVHAKCLVHKVSKFDPFFLVPYPSLLVNPILFYSHRSTVEIMISPPMTPSAIMVGWAPPRPPFRNSVGRAKAATN